MEVPLDCDVDQFAVFELVLKKRGRIWRWSVCTSEGAVLMEGSESSRPAAKYKAARALFLLLLSAPYQSIRMSRADDVRRIGVMRALHRHKPEAALTSRR